jgi:hypothetical protein
MKGFHDLLRHKPSSLFILWDGAQSQSHNPTKILVVNERNHHQKAPSYSEKQSNTTFETDKVTQFPYRETYLSFILLLLDSGFHFNKWNLKIP